MSAPSILADGADAAARYLIRDAAGRTFGPVALPTLLAWVRESRVEPTCAVSRDGAAWLPAPEVPELAMVWIVETEPGRFYGPFHRAVVDDLQRTGQLSAAARCYRLDGEAADPPPPAAGQTRPCGDCERLAAALARAEESLAAAERTIGVLETAVAAAEAEKNALEERLAAAEREGRQARARVEALEREQAAAPVTAVIAAQPLVPAVIAAAPPARRVPRFLAKGNPAALAALEAAAARELAAAKRRGFDLRSLFGGRK